MSPLIGVICKKSLTSSRLWPAVANLVVSSCYFPAPKFGGEENNKFIIIKLENRCCRVVKNMGPAPPAPQELPNVLLTMET